MTRRDFVETACVAALAFNEAEQVHAEPLTSLAPNTRHAVVLTRQPRQTIDHFGASACWTLDPIGALWDCSECEEISRLLFSQTEGAGLSLFRFNLGAGDQNPDGYSNPWRRPNCVQMIPNGPVDEKHHAGQLRFLQSAKRRGAEKSLAFVNSPPIWMTKNGRAFGDAQSGTTNLRSDSEHDFGRYLGDILKRFEDIGLPFDYISPINEPNWDWNGGQEGCRYGNEDLQRVLPVLGNEIARRRGIRATMRVPEIGILTALLDDNDFREYKRVSRSDLVSTGNPTEAGKRREYLSDLLGNRNVSPSLQKHILAHSYFTGDTNHDLTVLRAAVRRNLDRYAPDAAFWQTEFCVMEHKRDLGMETALRVAAVVHAGLTIANAAAWSWWLAVSEADYKDGLIYTDFKPSGGPRNVLPSKTLWTIGHWSRFVRPGSRRVDVLSDLLPDELLVSAYMDRAHKITIVAVNPTEKARELRLSADRSMAPMTQYITDATRSLLRLAAPCDSIATIPAQSVVTLVENSTPIRSGAPIQIPTLRSPIKREQKGDALYAVACGSSNGNPAETGARRNSREDMPYGIDPGTGFQWGYSSFGESSAQDKRNRNAGDLHDDTLVVRWDDGDTPGKGLTYRLEISPAERVAVELTFRDPWKNPERRMDVAIDGNVVDSDLVPGAEIVMRRYVLVGAANGELEIEVRRSAGNADPKTDPMLAEIRILPL